MLTYQQDGLLEKRNALLREQNELLRQLTYTSNYDGRIIYVDNIDRDEIRSDFLVTSRQKKLWNVQINLIKEFDRICKKHDIRWFAICGTLLGAARHGGFVPWDDDVDVAMLRPDYEKFRKIVESEIEPPYQADIWYNYRLEIDEPSELTDNSLPLISDKHHKKYLHGHPLFPNIKIRDKRTLFIEFPEDRTFDQCVWLDIFPLDSLPPFAEKHQQVDFEKAKVFFTATVHPEMIKETLQNKQSLVVDEKTLQNFMKLPYKQRGIKFEEFLAEKFFMSEHVGDLRGWSILSSKKFYQSKDFREVTYLPFEKTELPAPVNYESVLTDFYGDWRTPVKTHTHASIYSTNISWEEYLQQTPAK